MIMYDPQLAILIVCVVWCGVVWCGVVWCMCKCRCPFVLVVYENMEVNASLHDR